MSDTLGEGSLAISYKMFYFCIVPAGYYTCKFHLLWSSMKWHSGQQGLSLLQCDLCNIYPPNQSSINVQGLVAQSVSWHRREFTAILLDFALCFSTFTLSYSYLLTNFIICHGPAGLFSTLVKEAFYWSRQWWIKRMGAVQNTEPE